MTLKEIEPAGELDINKSADSDGSSGEQSPRATAVPLACISSTKKSTKTYLKSKEKVYKRYFCFLFNFFLALYTAK